VKRTWSDVLGWLFTGWVLGLITACALAMSVGGCWHGEVVREVPVVEWRTPTVSRWDCHKLVALVGKVPHEPLFLECADPDPANYYYCRADQYRRWAESMRDWIHAAIAECTP
jgi:hypothetical protein